MKKYIIYVREVWHQPVLVEAENAEQAISSLKEKGADCKDFTLLQGPKYHAEFISPIKESYIASIEETNSY